MDPVHQNQLFTNYNHPSRPSPPLLFFTLSPRLPPSIPLSSLAILFFHLSPFYLYYSKQGGAATPGTLIPDRPQGDNL